jgi:hypothetical protein
MATQNRLRYDVSRMRRRRTEIWMTWALPLIVLRLLLPAGVMPTASAFGPTLSICSASNLGRSSPQSPDAPRQGGSHDDMVCPFAAAATAAPANTTSVMLPVRTGYFVDHFAPSTQRIAQAGPLRTQRSRAPPTNS